MGSACLRDGYHRLKENCLESRVHNSSLKFNNFKVLDKLCVMQHGNFAHNQRICWRKLIQNSAQECQALEKKIQCVKALVWRQNLKLEKCIDRLRENAIFVFGETRLNQSLLDTESEMKWQMYRRTLKILMKASLMKLNTGFKRLNSNKESSKSEESTYNKKVVGFLDMFLIKHRRDRRWVYGKCLEYAADRKKSESEKESALKFLLNKFESHWLERKLAIMNILKLYKERISNFNKISAEKKRNSIEKIFAVYDLKLIEGWRGLCVLNLEKKSQDRLRSDRMRFLLRTLVGSCGLAKRWCFGELTKLKIEMDAKGKELENMRGFWAQRLAGVCGDKVKVCFGLLKVNCLREKFNQESRAKLTAVLLKNLVKNSEARIRVSLQAFKSLALFTESHSIDGMRNSDDGKCELLRKLVRALNGKVYLGFSGLSRNSEREKFSETKVEASKAWLVKTFTKKLLGKFRVSFQSLHAASDSITYAKMSKLIILQKTLSRISLSAYSLYHYGLLVLRRHSNSVANLGVSQDRKLESLVQNLKSRSHLALRRSYDLLETNCDVRKLETGIEMSIKGNSLKKLVFANGQTLERCFSLLVGN